jgi:hypothetical protein
MSERLRDANIKQRTVRRRAPLGVAVLVAGVAVLAWLVLAGWPRWWRLFVAIPFFMGTLNILEAREKT